MSRILPISTTRVTDAMKRQRLTGQIQADQVDLFRLQNQLSTGRRIFLPSDDAASAQRASVLQRTLERKAQSLTNLLGARASLVDTETAINDVGDQLSKLKSDALSALDSFALEDERKAFVNTIDELLNRFTDTGNASFATNFLLGGSERSTSAYSRVGEYVEYLGDESTSRTFVDIGLLFDQGVSGDEVLGGLSESVRGVADLNPQLTPETSLSRLNGGRGITTGSISLSYTPSSPSQAGEVVTIDLSSASTIEDVARLIESNSPSGAGVAVSIEGGSLRVDAADGLIGIDEVASGRAARELGLQGQAAAGSLLGEDLNPALDLTTRLEDLVGSRTRGRLVAPGSNNDLVLTANTNGAEFNNLVINYQSGAVAGSETATYTPPASVGAPGTLTIQIAEGPDGSTAAEIAAAISAEGTFTAEPDSLDQTSFAARGTGTVTTVTADDLAVGFAGGVDGSLDLASGLIVTNGDNPVTVDTSGAETVADLLNLFNDPALGLQATINATGDGLDVRTRRSGADFSIGENGGDLAAQLGIRTYTGESRLADFNRGAGVLTPGEGATAELRDADTLRQNPFVITVVEDGLEEVFTIDPRGLTTVDDLIQQINDDTNGKIEARLVSTGNGIELVATDNDVAAAQSSVTFSLTNDTPGATSLTIEADTVGPGPTFALEVVDNGGGATFGATLNPTTNVIEVELAGVPATGANIASAIEGTLPGYTVTLDTDGTETISAAPQSPTGTDIVTGAVDSALATQGRGSFVLNGDTISISSDQAGPGGNLPELAINVINSGGAGPLSAELVGDVVTVDLAGLGSSTDAIAAVIQTALNDASSGSDPPQTYTVASDGTAAVATTDADPPPTVAAVTGGALLTDTIATGDFDLNGDTITIVSDQVGPGGNLPALTIELVDNGGTGPLSAGLVGDTVTVDLAGLASSTDAIAAEIQAALNLADPSQSYTVASDGTTAVATTDAGGPAVAAAVTGGALSVDTIATGEFDLNGDTITIRSIRVGPDGNLPDLAIEFVDSGGAGPLTAELAGDTLTVDLAGLNSSTGAIATAIQTALDDSVSGLTPPQSFSVTSTGNAVVATTDVGAPSVAAAVTGGRAVDSITVSGSYAERLGFLSPGQESVTIEDTDDPNNPEGVLASTDNNTREVDSVFTTLLRLREAVQANDDEAFAREIERIDVDFDRATFARAEIGTRIQNLNTIQDRLADEEVTLREALSQEIDADLAEVISEFTAKQFALQASLQTSSRLLNLTILDFL